MRFSIITITKQNPAGFAKTKASVNAQTYKDYEWVVIDGDKEPDSGIYDAMNKGINRANGDYLIFMNAGDEFANVEALGLVSQHNADFIYGDAIEGGEIKQARSHKKIKNGMITHHQAMIYKRDVIDDLRYDEKYKLAADYKFTIEFLRRTPHVHYINSPLCIFEQGGVSQKYAAEARKEERRIRKELCMYAPFTYWRQMMAYKFRQNFPRLFLKLRAVTR